MPPTNVASGSVTSSERKNTSVRRFRLRIPAWLFVGFLVVFCAAACVIIAFLAIYFPIQSQGEDSLIEFTEAIATLTADKLQSRFEVFRSAGRLAQRVLAHTPAFLDLDNRPSSSAGDHLLPLDDTLRWFARTIYPIDMTLVLFHGVVDGFIMKSYSSLDGYNFPKRPGIIAVSNLSSASLSSYVDTGYFSLDTFLPINATNPWYRNHSLTYNVSSRSFFPSIQKSNFKLTWTPIYVSFAQSTSAIGFGTTWGTYGGNVTTQRSTFSFHGNAGDIVELFKNISIGKTGAALLVDVSTRAFIGGNLIDPSIKMNTTTNRPRFVLLEELEDPRVGPVIDAAAVAGGGDRTNLLLSCTGTGPPDPATGIPEPCLFAFYYKKNFLEPISDYKFSLIATDVALVHVSRVVDEFGLDMRLVLVISTDDFVGELRRGTVRSVAITVPVVCAVVLLVSLATHVLLLSPLRNMADVLSEIVKADDDQELPRPSNEVNHARRNQVAGPTSSSSPSESSQQHAVPLFTRPKQMRSAVERIPVHRIKELSTIRFGIMKLLAALDLVGLFLPPPSQQPLLIDFDDATQKNSSMASLSAGGPSDDAMGKEELSSEFSPHSPQTPRAETREGKLAVTTNQREASTKEAQNNRWTAKRVVVMTSSNNPLNKTFSGATLHTVLATTVVANFVGLEGVRFATRQLPSTFTEIHTEYLRVVMNACTSHGGTVDLFYGDRIWAHFNAERRLPGHALKACRAILAMEDAIDAASLSRRFSASDRTSADTSTPWRDKRYSLRIRLGAATTEALCGVMGSCGVKRFTVVGACVWQAALLCASAGPKRIRHETSLPSDGIVGSRTPTAQDVLSFSSLLATKTVELARIRSVARNRSKQNVGNVAESPSHPSPTKKDSSKNTTTGQEIVFRHVRMSAFMPNALHDQSVVSTPVLLSRILEEYPAHIVQSSPEVALQRMNAVNAVYEHIVAGNTAAANQLVGSLSFWDDEWLLRQIRQGISRN